MFQCKGIKLQIVRADTNMISLRFTSMVLRQDTHLFPFMHKETIYDSLGAFSVLPLAPLVAIGSHW